MDAARRAALASGAPLPPPWDHAHYLWFFFAAIGVVAFLALLVFARVTSRPPRR